MKFVKALTALAVATVLASTANAGTVTYNGTAANQPYVGVKVARISDTFEKSGRYNLTGYGIYGGYNFDEHFGAEGEYLISDKKELQAGSGVQNKAQVYGAYGTYRQNFGDTPFYGKAKVGVAKVEEKLYGAGAATSNSDTGFAYGLAAGYQTGNLGVEASFSRPHKDVDAVSIGANLAF